MSDSEAGSQFTQSHGQGQVGGSFAQGNFSATLLPPIVDIPPPKVETAEKEIVTYSKEVQTSAWVQEEDSEEDGEELVKRRVEEELRRELEKIKLEEQRMKQEEALRQEVEKKVPGMLFCGMFGVNGRHFGGGTETDIDE